MEDEFLIPATQGGAVVLMELALKSGPEMETAFVQQFIGKWFITYTEMGVPLERQFRVPPADLKAGKGPVYQKLKEYALDLAMAYRKFPADVFLLAWQMGINNWRDEGKGDLYPLFDVSRLRQWLKKYMNAAAAQLYPKGWPGQKIHAPEPEESPKPLPMPIHMTWNKLKELEKLDKHMWTLAMAGFAYTDLFQEIANRLKADNPKLYNHIAWVARNKFRRNISITLLIHPKNFRGLSNADMSSRYETRCGENWVPLRYYWKQLLYELGDTYLTENYGKA